MITVEKSTSPDGVVLDLHDRDDHSGMMLALSSDQYDALRDAFAYGGEPLEAGIETDPASDTWEDTYPDETDDTGGEAELWARIDKLECDLMDAEEKLYDERQRANLAEARVDQLIRVMETQADNAYADRSFR